MHGRHWLVIFRKKSRYIMDAHFSQFLSSLSHESHESKIRIICTRHERHASGFYLFISLCSSGNPINSFKSERQGKLNLISWKIEVRDICLVVAHEQKHGDLSPTVKQKRHLMKNCKCQSIPSLRLRCKQRVRRANAFLISCLMRKWRGRKNIWNSLP